MIVIWVIYYIEPTGSVERQFEIDECLRRNIANTHIDKICVFAENCVVPFESPKVVVIPTSRRLTFSNIMGVIASLGADSDINIIPNSDIFFDETVLLMNRMTKDEHWSLAKWEYNGGNPYAFLAQTSADVFAIRGHPKPLSPSPDFTMGIPGCEAVLRNIMYRSGYSILNPCISVRCIHMHESGMRHSQERKQIWPDTDFWNEFKKHPTDGPNDWEPPVFDGTWVLPSELK